jgi:hypothetical protein
MKTGNPGILLPITRINKGRRREMLGVTSQHYLIEHAEYDEVAFGETVGQIFRTGNPAQNANFLGTK